MQDDELDEYTEYLQSSNLWKWKTIQANPTVVPTNTVLSLAQNNFEKSDHLIPLRNKV